MLLGLAHCRGEGGQRSALPVPGESGGRVVVEVLNASERPGLARVGTRVLRQGGIDVASFGNAPTKTPTLDSTRIVVRRGAAQVGRRVRDVLGVGTVTVQLDSTKLLDASVLLGRDFMPRLSFHP